MGVERQLRHMVLLRFQPAIAAAQIEALFADLEALQSHLTGITAFRRFNNTSPETAVVHGFAQGFWFDFENTAARDAYLIDAQHKAIGARLVAACGGVDGLIVVDFSL